MKTWLDFTTALFVPADRPERFAKAAAAGADAVIIDLEDAVAPSSKASARETLSPGQLNVPLILRINGAGTQWHAQDIAVAAQLDLVAIMLPKAEMDGTLEALQQGPARHLPVIALIETARGLDEARAIAASPGIARLAFGSIDFCADLGCAHQRNALLLARSSLVLASRLAGLPAPIDGVTTAIDDDGLVADDARYGRALGFGGKLCIHPRQIGPVKAGYHPDEAEIAWAEKVLNSGDAAVAVDGAMVDEPVRIRARRILALAAVGR
ncbi:HpcH/HpaI aldolase/citrate lyase family protein [Rhizobium sp. C4]|uniref:HpcH/HpaI aldolase/citrate lyase family protein n=1 Tax=Rhizobium sp. C4 TaxID=1349800 RepID=UPI001E3DCC21|nr:CoA ester lyase [Rhizobium sp. C4]MCD2172210.1 CoA ester lyase [Rhizobium sp. C4]